MSTQILNYDNHLEVDWNPGTHVLTLISCMIHEPYKFVYEMTWQKHQFTYKHVHIQGFRICLFICISIQIYEFIIPKLMNKISWL